MIHSRVDAVRHAAQLTVCAEPAPRHPPAAACVPSVSWRLQLAGPQQVAAAAAAGEEEERPWGTNAKPINPTTDRSDREVTSRKVRCDSPLWHRGLGCGCDGGCFADCTGWGRLAINPQLHLHNHKSHRSQRLREDNPKHTPRARAPLTVSPTGAGAVAWS
eukprot:COSAG01_NODE_7015_length_3392_cov_1.507136_5_plen_161_part_00